MAATANLRIDQGASFSSDVTVKDNTGTVFDLTNYTAAAKMALGYSSTRTRVAMTTTISDPTNGVITLSLTADQTSALEAPARYVYDVEVVSSANVVSRIVEGIVTITPEVTR